MSHNTKLVMANALMTELTESLNRHDQIWRQTGSMPLTGYTLSTSDSKYANIRRIIMLRQCLNDIRRQLETYDGWKPERERSAAR